MRRLYSFILFYFFFILVSFSQKKGNEWLNPDQPYYKIKVAREGFYKISYELLKAQDVPPYFFAVNKLQLWHRGKQQSISISTKGDSLLDGDYIMFYGQRNDGWQDSLLYHPNTEFYDRYTSMYSDTTGYFLTVSDNNTIARSDTLFSSLPPTGTDLPLRTTLQKSYFGGYRMMAVRDIDPAQVFAVPGEGWSTDWDRSLSETINLNDYQSGDTTFMEIMLVSEEKKALSPIFTIGFGTKTLQLPAWSDTTANAFTMIKAKFKIVDDLSQYMENGMLKITIDNGVVFGGFGIKYINVTYSHKRDMASVARLNVGPSRNGVNVRLENIPSSHLIAQVTDPNHFKWVKENIQGSTSFLPPANTTDRFFYALGFDSVTILHRTNFRHYAATANTYLILTHGSLMSSVKKYADYRASPQGGSYDTIIAEVNDVMDQFSYGEKSPMGVRRFLNYLKGLHVKAPGHFFIIGQGIQLDRQREHRLNPSQPPSEEDMVLTGGVPGGDYIFSIGLDGKEGTIGYGDIRNFYSTIPTGRLQTKRNEIVLDYLSKVQQHESVRNEDATWRRNVLHLSGGYRFGQSEAVNAAQANAIRVFTDGFANLLRLPYFGANVNIISRAASADPLVDMSSQINKGVSLITFLGHSGRLVTDVWIGSVSDGNNNFGYANKGKYPMLFLNGCEMGDIYVDIEKAWEKSVVLDWVTTKDRGAIGGYASSSVSFLLQLKLFIENYYISSYLDSINMSKSIGEQIVLAQKRYIDVFSGGKWPDPVSASTIGSYSFQGDPSVHMFPNPKADYLIDCEKVALVPLNNKKITSQADSFDIAIPIRNQGIYTPQKFTIGVKRLYANNTQSILYSPQTYFPVKELDTVYFRVRGALPQGNGQNTFEISVDPLNAVSEVSENNNSCNLVAYIPGITMLTLQPKKFSIVSKQPVTFVAQSSIATAKEREFYMELDTSYTFDSPFKKSFVTKGFDLPMWSSSLLPDVEQNDSIVYYWRTRYSQPEAVEDSAFSYSSFFYIKDSPEGWSQSEYPQFLENNFQGIRLDSLTGKWFFEKNLFGLSASVVGADVPKYDSVAFLSYRDVPLIVNRNCGSSNIDGLYILTIDPSNMRIRQTSMGIYGDYQCDVFTSPLVSRVRFMGTRPAEQDSLYKILDRNIKKGDYVLLMSIGNAGFSSFGSSLKSLLTTQFGATRMDSLKDGHPYLLLTRKGEGKLVEKFPKSAQRSAESIYLDTLISSLGYAGQISSPLIGPATQWGSFINTYVKEFEDSVRFDIAGIDSSGREQVLISNIKENQVNLEDQINAARYPYLRLYAYEQTKTSVTPQLLRWQVILKKSPEGTLVFNDSSSTNYASFTQQEGETPKALGFAFKNISSQPFGENLIVRYKITNPSKNVTYYDTLRTLLTPDSIWKTTFKVPNIGWVGSNTLEVFFNPSPGQREEYLDNNRYTIKYTVTADKTNPLLEVAFDGKRIMNGEIVPPNPTISIGVNDENKYLIRQDAVGITVDLQRPCGQPNCPYERINLTSSEVTIYPSPSNKFELRYKPINLPDGKYNLRVQAADVSGNLSGLKPYTIQFEIVNETTISNFLPYPNPFSSRMWFVYTLTGEIPDQLRIQIMTVTGKVVKHIFLEDLGPLSIGTHRTEYVWDGSDDYGDLLANGLYVYNVTARKNGEEIKHRETSMDGMFKDGYGKLYILR